MMMMLLGFILSILFICAVLFCAVTYWAYKRNRSIIEQTKNVIRMFETDRAMPSDYIRVFVNNDSGRKVLEQLVIVFASDTYVRGGADAERESCYKQGQKSVIDHINYAIAKAKTNTGEKSDG